MRALRRALKVIASIEEPELIERVHAHRRERGEEDATNGPARGAGGAAGRVVLIAAADELAGSCASGGQCCARRAGRVHSEPQRPELP